MSSVSVPAEERDKLKTALQHYISQNGMKSSRQRDVVADIFFERYGHRSVDDLLSDARDIDPKISQATVYRTVKLLTAAGLAEPRRFFDNQTLYEPARLDEDHHDHLICIKCGKIVEFVDDRIEKLQDQVAATHGFVVTHHRMELFGHCNDPKTCVPMS